MDQLRIEILLPLYYNPDENNNRKPIEDEKFTETLNELIIQFKGYSANQYLVQGEWIDEETGIKFDDQSRPIWIVCDDTLENKDILLVLKERLMERFQQHDIMMYYSIVHRF